LIDHRVKVSQAWMERDLRGTFSKSHPCGLTPFLSIIRQMECSISKPPSSKDGNEIVGIRLCWWRLRRRLRSRGGVSDSEKESQHPVSHPIVWDERCEWLKARILPEDCHVTDTDLHAFVSLSSILAPLSLHFDLRRNYLLGESE